MKEASKSITKNCGNCLFTQGKYFDGTCDNIPNVPGAAEISEGFVCANWKERIPLPFVQGCDCDKHVTSKCVCGGKCICHTIGIYFDTKPSEGFIYKAPKEGQCIG